MQEEIFQGLGQDAELIAEKDNELKEKRLRSKSERNVQKMIDRYLDAKQRGSTFADTLRIFAEVALTLHEVNLQLLDVKAMFEVVGDSLNIMDDCLNAFKDMAEEHSESLSESFRTRRLVTKLKKSMKRKIKNISRAVKGVVGMASDFSRMFKSLSRPGFFKRKKEDETSKANFDAYLEKYIASKNGGNDSGNGGPAPVAPTGAGTKPAEKNNGGDVSDVSDII